MDIRAGNLVKILAQLRQPLVGMRSVVEGLSGEFDLLEWYNPRELGDFSEEAIREENARGEAHAALDALAAALDVALKHATVLDEFAASLAPDAPLVPPLNTLAPGEKLAFPQVTTSESVQDILDEMKGPW